MYLPGTIHERICDLRISKGLQQKELAEMIGISASQLSRIETGETQSVSADTVARLAKALHVSADYILGLTTISAPKNYEISELGLSEGAVKALIAGAVDRQILNRLLEHKSFPSLARFIKIYFEDEHVAGIIGRNEIIDLTSASVEAFAKANPEHKGEAIADIRFLQAERLGANEADIEKIKNTFLAILRDIKKDMAENTAPTPTATSNYMKKIQSQLPDPVSAKPTADHIAAAVTGLVGMAGVMDAETTTMLQEVVRRILESNT